MIFLQIFLLSIFFLLLFVLFLENRFFFDFHTPSFWNIRWENLFFKYSFGSDGNDFEFFIKFKKKEKPLLQTKAGFENLKENNYSDYKKNNLNSGSEKQSEKPKKQRNNLEKFEEKNYNDYKSSDKTEMHDENKEENEINWFVFIKEIWEKEEKTIKKLLKYIVKVIKLSLKLLTPAKIKLNLFGGVEDPAETGWLYSSFILFNMFFEENRQISLNFVPNFTQPEWKFDGHIEYNFSIARILLFVLLIILYFPYISTIKCLHRNRKSIWNKK